LIIDSHSHAWPRWPYQPPVPDDGSRGRIEQLLFEMDENGVDCAVAICARIDRNEDNNEYVADEAAKHPDRVYQFPDVDGPWRDEYHTPGAAGRLKEIAERWPIKGFTHYLKAEPDGWLISDDGMEFFSVAAEKNLIASIAGGPRWQPELRRIAEAFPSLPILCHHLGGVRASGGPDESGLGEVLDSAALPNILIKASGFYYGSADWWNFPYADSISIFQSIYEAFGPHRLCWGSDYPVASKGRCTYKQSLEVLRTHCRFVSEEDMRWILGETLHVLLTTGHPVPTSGTSKSNPEMPPELPELMQ
jgi:predicted TIM-barrel fold metal-dependent hydrolase